MADKTPRRRGSALAQALADLDHDDLTEEDRAELRAEEEAFSGADPAPPRRRAAGRSWLIDALVGLVIMALAAGLVLAVIKLHNRDAVDKARASSLAAAKTYAINLTSYDYQHLDQDFAKVEKYATPTFAKDFAQSSGALSKVLTQYKAGATAKIVAAGVTSASTGRAVVVVVLDQTLTNSTQKAGSTTDQSRVLLTLVHQHGHWLLDHADLLQ